MKARKWRVCESKVDGKSYWFVYCLRSVCVPDEYGNRIYSGECFDTEADAKKYASILNNEILTLFGDNWNW